MELIKRRLICHGYRRLVDHRAQQGEKRGHRYTCHRDKAVTGDNRNYHYSHTCPRAPPGTIFTIAPGSKELEGHRPHWCVRAGAQRQVLGPAQVVERNARRRTRSGHRSAPCRLHWRRCKSSQVDDNAVGASLRISDIHR